MQKRNNYHRERRECHMRSMNSKPSEEDSLLYASMFGKGQLTDDLTIGLDISYSLGV